MNGVGPVRCFDVGRRSLFISMTRSRSFSTPYGTPAQAHQQCQARNRLQLLYAQIAEFVHVVVIEKNRRDVPGRCPSVNDLGKWLAILHPGRGPARPRASWIVSIIFDSSLRVFDMWLNLTMTALAPWCDEGIVARTTSVPRPMRLCACTVVPSVSVLPSCSFK